MAPVSAPDGPRECALVIEALGWVVNHMGAFLGPDLEVVLHDLARPDASVVAIANGRISRRTVGSAIFSGPFGDKGLRELIQGGDVKEPVTVVGDYRTRLPDGRELDSLSLMFRDANGTAFAALCANADRSRLQQLKALVDGMFAPAPEDVAEQPDASVEVMVERIIEESISAATTTPNALTKDERIEAVLAMRDRGLFLVRSSVEVAAARLGVSRHTIYNYLERGR